ncbi:MAG: hypothetical protein KF716_18285 [Anaerolineae bacterium]|nr:hypothetical protein [Anaerolineae bacterium]
MTDDPRLKRLVDLEQHTVIYDQAAPDDESPIRVVRGSQPILISAPHSARHWRDGDWKPEDEYTAALGWFLHETLGAYFIYSRYQLQPDPHDDGDANPYKQVLADLVATTPFRLALDLHGARGDRDFAVAIGTIGGQTFAPYESQLVTAFEQHGFIDQAPTSLDRLALNLGRYMGGARLPTITRFLWEQHQLPCAQIELSAWMRIVQRLPNATNAKNMTSPDFRGDPARILRVLEALTSFLRQILTKL